MMLDQSTKDEVDVAIILLDNYCMCIFIHGLISNSLYSAHRKFKSHQKQ